MEMKTGVRETEFLFLNPPDWFTNSFMNPYKFKINEDKSLSLKKEPNKFLGMHFYDENEQMPSIEELAELCSKVHKLPTEWFEEYREKIC